MASPSVRRWATPSHSFAPSTARGRTCCRRPNVRLDRRGHALVPQLSPYRRNRVGIEVRGASTDVAFDWTERDVVPRAGAIIDVPLASAYRPMHFVRIVGGDGLAPSFGARIVDATGTTRALVGREGLARVPADGDAWFLEGHAHPCTIATGSADSDSRRDVPGFTGLTSSAVRTRPKPRRRATRATRRSRSAAPSPAHPAPR